ncbi:phage baseplate assembly protein V [Undibacterium sp. CCC3.4]|uniref:phage baseplate assembly protein V n=2 Tax=Undibacterium TaxID=401469 RepID=UPI002AC9C11D|nr:phage baseplate assembly protein V [Undibacterium sp. CCC3.4]MEB0177015.1 phage baseplate assembly protein V [Undibacterium sp. CCC3.4]WPX42488.1 phage baseplate assembly protein V [Undibacterium sp. CCC3.4]
MVCMTADRSELLRLLLNLIRLGRIVECDYAQQRARVLVGKNLTDWRPWLTERAGDTQTWWAPSEGEQVLVLSPEGDFNQSVIVGAIYSDRGAAPSSNPAQHLSHYQDDASISYDWQSHTLSAVLPAGSHAFIKADQVTADAPETTCTGNLTVQKNLIVNGMSMLNAGMAVLPGATGDSARIEGRLTVSADVEVSGISLVAHRHGGIQAGGAQTGGPQ